MNCTLDLGGESRRILRSIGDRNKTLAKATLSYPPKMSNNHSVISSEAKQSRMSSTGLLRRFAPRNDRRTNARIPAAWAARVCANQHPRKREGAGKAGAINAPAASHPNEKRTRA